MIQATNLALGSWRLDGNGVSNPHIYLVGAVTEPRFREITAVPDVRA
jgi:hypothetical protein